MKRVALILFYGFLVSGLFSQTTGTITSSTLDQPTDGGIVFSITTSGDVWPDEEDVGLDQTWNFSNLSSNFQLSMGISYNTDDEIGEEFFAEADLIWIQNIDGFLESRTYVKNNPDGAFRAGLYNNAQAVDQVTSCDDEKQLLDYPFSIGFSWSDSYSSVIVGLAQGFQSEEVGKRIATVDASGSLELPNAFYEDVHRVLIQETGTNQSFLDGSPIGPNESFEREIIEFWTPVFGAPIATFTTNTFGGQSFFEVQYIESGPLSLPDLSVDKDFLLYPNPTNEFINLKLKKLSSVETITLTDILGRSVLDEIDPMSPSIRIDVSHLEQGIYQVHVKTREGIQTSKFMITH